MTTEPGKNVTPRNVIATYGSAEGIGDGTMDNSTTPTEEIPQVRTKPEDPILTPYQRERGFLRSILQCTRLSLQESKEGFRWVADETKETLGSLRQRVAHWLGPVASSEASIKGVDMALHKGPYGDKLAETQEIEQPPRSQN